MGDYRAVLNRVPIQYRYVILHIGGSSSTYTEGRDSTSQFARVIAIRPRWWLLNIGSGNGVVPSANPRCILTTNHSLQWRHNGPDGVPSHQPHNSLLNRLFRRRSSKTSKLLVTGLCVGNSPVTGKFPAQITSNAENVSIDYVIMGVITLD